MTRTMPGWVLRRTALLSWGGSVLVIVENDARNDAQSDARNDARSAT